MITIPTTPEQSLRIVILRRRGKGWSALLGNLKEGSLKVEETRLFDEFQPRDSSDPKQNELETWLEEQGNPDVHLLIQACVTISRVLDLNPEDDEDLDQTLRLQAESHLLGGAPAHRVGMVTLPARPHTNRQGVVITWPESSVIDSPPITQQPLCIPETAALLALTPETELDGPLLHVERSTESLALVLEIDGRLVLRSTRESSNDDATWRDAVTHSVIETAITANEPLDKIDALRNEVRAAIEGRDELLLLPSSLRSYLLDAVEGTGDETWWQEWGLSVGALLASTGPLHPLTTFRLHRPVQSGGALGEMMRTLSKSNLMIPILIAAFFAITAIPMATAWVRLKIIENKIEDQSKLEQVLETTDMQKGVYIEIAKRSWPITKLLGDLANCVPLGIEAETIIVNEGDSIILRGSAGAYKGQSPIALIHEMLGRMKSTNVFTDFNYSEDPINSGGRVEFSINTRVEEPFRQVRSFTQDFAKTSHAQLRYPHAFDEDGNAIGSSNGSAATPEHIGDTASTSNNDLVARVPTSTSRTGVGESSTGDTPPGVGRSSLLGPRGGGVSSSNRSGSSSSRTGSIIGSTGSATRRSQGTGARGTGGPAPIPESPTDTELGAMSKSEAKDLLTRIAEARQREDLDEETNKRLKEDFNRVLEHMRTANDDGGNG